MPTPLCALTTIIRYSKGGGFQLGWQGQPHGLFPALDRSTYGVSRLATVTTKQMALDSMVSRAILIVLSIYPPAGSRTRLAASDGELKVITEAEHDNVFVFTR